jgi:hypothetical protein
VDLRSSWIRAEETALRRALFHGPSRTRHPGANRALAHDPEKWVPVSRLREAVAPFVVWLDASAGEGRSEKIMRQ